MNLAPLKIADNSGSKANDRMITTLFLAAMFHGIVILGVSFGVAGTTDPDTLPTLEVLLVDTRLPEARTNDRADYLAQRNSQGSGNAPESARTSSPPSSPLPFDNPGLPQGEALDTQDLAREHSTPNVLATSAPATRILHFTDAAEETNTGTPQVALLMRSGPVSPLPSSDDGDQLILKGQRQGELLITPNTRESDVAVYLDAWKRKVERIGTLHFPSEARRGLSGSPVLEVAIRSNGVLEDIVIRRPSGHAELDRATLAILKLSTPFDPFPAALRARHKVLRFAYEWQFLGGELVDSAVQAPASP